MEQAKQLNSDSDHQNPSNWIERVFNDVLTRAQLANESMSMSMSMSISINETNKPGRTCATDVAIRRIFDGIRFLQRDGNPHRRSAWSFDHLGKLAPISHQHLDELRVAWRSLVNPRYDSPPCIVLGLSESGIVPSYAMSTAIQQMGIACDWFCTTREESETNAICFREPHSHAPVHYLPAAIFQQPESELWLVEDEITTGKTLQNLLQCIERRMKLSCVRVFCLLDHRSSVDRNRLRDWASVRDVSLIESALFSSAPSSSFAGGPESFSFPQRSMPVGRRQPDRHWEAGTRRVSSWEADCHSIHLSFGEQIARDLPFIDEGHLKCLQQITRSPWLVDGKQVHSRREVREGYYLYNHHACHCGE